MRQRKKVTAAQKATVAREALRGERTHSEIASQFGVHPTQVKKWKQQAEGGLEGLFADKRTKPDKDKDELIKDLYQLIGKRDTELEWLKKKMQHFPAE